MDTYDVAYLAALNAQLVVLYARFNRARDFMLNSSLKMECYLLETEIAAVENEVKLIEGKYEPKE